MTGFGIWAGGILHRVPEGASAIAAPVLRPVPGGGGRLMVGMLGASAVPAWVLPGAACPALAWVLVPHAEGALLLGGDALEEAGAAVLSGAPPVPAPAYPPPRLRRAGVPEGVAEEGAESRVAPVPSRGGFRILLPGSGLRAGGSHDPEAGVGQGGAVLDIPFAALVRILPAPPSYPAPHAPAPATGLAWTVAGPVLLLDPGSFGGGGDGPVEAPLLAVVVSSGRQFGIPCQGVVPLRQDAVLPAALSHPALLAAAPPAPVPEAVVTVPTRLFLVAQASGIDFALPVEEVAAVLAPRYPRNRGGGALGGIAAHRGDVLPVLDAGLRLGRAPVLGAGQPVPMLRLGGSFDGPLAAVLAVTAVRGLRAVPEGEVAGIGGEGLVSHVLRLDGAALPVLRARALVAVLAAGPVGLEADAPSGGERVA